MSVCIYFFRYSENLNKLKRNNFLQISLSMSWKKISDLLKSQFMDDYSSTLEYLVHSHVNHTCKMRPKDLVIRLTNCNFTCMKHDSGQDVSMYAGNARVNFCFVDIERTCTSCVWEDAKSKNVCTRDVTSLESYLSDVSSSVPTYERGGDIHVLDVTWHLWTRANSR